MLLQHSSCCPMRTHRFPPFAMLYLPTHAEVEVPFGAVVCTSGKFCTDSPSMWFPHWRVANIYLHGHVVFLHVSITRFLGVYVQVWGSASSGNQILLLLKMTPSVTDNSFLQFQNSWISPSRPFWMISTSGVMLFSVSHLMIWSILSLETGVFDVTMLT